MFGLHPDGTETLRRWTWSASPSPPLTSREFPDNRAPTRVRRGQHTVGAG